MSKGAWRALLRERDNVKKRCGGTVIAFLMLVCGFSFAQQGSTRATTRAESNALKLVERAEIARKTGDIPQAIKLYKQAIVAAPNDEKAFSGLSNALAFSETTRLKAEGVSERKPDGTFNEGFEKTVIIAQTRRLIEIYRPLATAHPQVVAYQFHLLMAQRDLAEMEGKHLNSWLPQLEKIVAANPNYVPALRAMGGSAASRGDTVKEKEYFCRAADAEPSDDMLAYFCLTSYKRGDKQEYYKRIEEFVSKYPNSMQAPAVLTTAANDSETAEERLAFLERESRLPGGKFVPELYDLRARADLRKTADELQEMLGKAQAKKPPKQQDPPNNNWELMQLAAAAEYYGHLARAEEMLKAGRIDEGIVEVDKAKFDPSSGAEPWPEFPKAKIMSGLLLAQGKASEAYKYVLGLGDVIADPDITALAVKVGTQLGKSQARVEDDIVSTVLANSKRPTDFELEKLKPGDGKFKLSELRGKFVTVSFWHPT